MTTEEKLENFYRHSIDSANAEAQRLVDEHQAALNQLFEEHKLLRKQQAEEEIAAETEKLKREANKALSAEQLSIKRSLSAKNMELKKKLFAEVREKMADFKRHRNIKPGWKQRYRMLCPSHPATPSGSIWTLPTKNTARNWKRSCPSP